MCGSGVGTIRAWTFRVANWRRRTSRLVGVLAEVEAEAVGRETWRGRDKNRGGEVEDGAGR